jgi:hypothetical protein
MDWGPGDARKKAHEKEDYSRSPRRAQEASRGKKRGCFRIVLLVALVVFMRSL